MKQMDSCDKYLELMSEYLDTNQMDALLKEHLETCVSCKVELKAMQSMVDELRALPAISLPQGFHGRAMENLRKEQKEQTPQKERKSFMQKPKKINFTKYTNVAAAVAVCFILLGSALSLTNNAIRSREFAQRDDRVVAEGVASWSYSATPAAAPAAPAPPPTAPAAGSPAPVAIQAEHMDIQAPPSGLSIAEEQIGHQFGGRGSLDVHSAHEEVVSRNHSITITVEDMEQAVLLLRLAGYEIESSSISEFGSFLSLNVPVHEFETARDLAVSLGEVNFEWEGRTDLTRATNDLAVRYLARLEESTRLASLINRAERAEDIILLQGRISQIEHERARFRGSYNQNLVNAQSVSMSINLNPVGTPIYYAPQSFSERMGSAFTSSVNFTTATFEGVLVLAASSVVPLALIAAVGGVGYFVYKKVNARDLQRGGHKHEEDE